MNRKRRLRHNTIRNRDELLDALADMSHTFFSGIAVALFGFAIITVLFMCKAPDHHQDPRRFTVANHD